MTTLAAILTLISRTYKHQTFDCVHVTSGGPICSTCISCRALKSDIYWIASNNGWLIQCNCAYTHCANSTEILKIISKYKQTKRIACIHVRHVLLVPVQLIAWRAALIFFTTFFLFTEFLQRVSIACYAKRCISYRKSVRLSVRLSVRPSHAGTVSKWLKLRSWGLHCRIAHDSSFLMVNVGAKFQREPRERGRQLREG